MPEKLVGKGTKPGSEREKMIVIFILGPRYTEKRLSGDKFKDKATETPDIDTIINGSGKNQFGESKTQWSNGFLWRVRKEKSYPR